MGNNLEFTLILNCQVKVAMQQVNNKHEIIGIADKNISAFFNAANLIQSLKNKLDDV